MYRSLLLLGLALLASFRLLAQTEQPPDDMPFIFLLGIALLSVAIGCIVVGVILSVLILSIILAMTSAGMISTAIMVGLYKRSVSAGFKTLIMLVCALGGIVQGIGGLYLVNKLFELDMTMAIIAWSGLAGGLIGGVLLALVIFWIIRVMIGLFRKKLSL